MSTSASSENAGPATLERWLAGHPAITTVVIATPDVNGVLRAKGMPIDQANKIETGQAAVPLSMPTVDFIGEEIPNCSEVTATGDGDIFVRRCPRDPFVSLTAPDTAIVLVDMLWEDGRAVETSCRHLLAGVIADCADEGLYPVVALEVEFYLFDPADPGLSLPKHPVTGRNMIGREPCHLQEFEMFSGFFKDVRAACTNAGIEVTGLGSENGTMMFEINVAHTGDVMKAADDLTILRLIIRDVARQHSYGATFMPKPFADLDGAGLHIHFSMLDQDGANVFDDGTSRGTDVLHHAVGGLLAHADDMQLVMAPHYSSYRRIQPNSYAPTLISWGYDNRFLPVRIPAGAGKNRRIEHRLGGADANPYLLTALVLRAALDGIKAKHTPPAPIVGSPYEFDLDDVIANMPDAIAAFRASDWIANVVPPLLRAAYLNAKQQELERISSHVSQWEIDIFRDRI